MLRKADILIRIRRGEVVLSPLEVRLAGLDPGGSEADRSWRPSAYVDIASGDRSYRFVAEVLSQATPRAFRAAMEQVKSYAVLAEMQPLLITTYLSPDRIGELESRGLSGIDLCGNGIVAIPGELLVVRTGSPNRYPSGRRIRNVYRGSSSLVSRVFLLQPTYSSVQSVMDEVVRRGGDVSLSTVSKVLKVLEEDLIIKRDGRASQLIQPEELLDRLAAGYRAPRIGRRRAYRWISASLTVEDALGSIGGGLVLTGAASVDRYTVMAREKSIQCYCEAIESVEESMRGKVEVAERFPDIELLETSDPTVSFDARERDGMRVSSPLQTWLELQAGDKRQQDASVFVRRRVLHELFPSADA